jgi:hypothetical protein
MPCHRLMHAPPGTSTVQRTSHARWNRTPQTTPPPQAPGWRRVSSRPRQERALHAATEVCAPTGGESERGGSRNRCQEDVHKGAALFGFVGRVKRAFGNIRFFRVASLGSYMRRIGRAVEGLDGGRWHTDHARRLVPLPQSQTAPLDRCLAGSQGSRTTNTSQNPGSRDSLPHSGRTWFGQRRTPRYPVARAGRSLVSGRCSIVTLLNPPCRTPSE